MKIEKSNVLKVLRVAKEYYMDARNLGKDLGMCYCINYAFCRLGLHPDVMYDDIPYIIPEFNRKFLSKNDTLEYANWYWWEICDFESRLKAFDKLIKIYNPEFEITSCFLRENSPWILEMLEREGLSICQCTKFEGSIWLDCLNSNVGATFEIHGIGYHDETECMKDPIGYHLNHLREGDIDCGIDVETFIKICKRITNK